MNKCAHCGYYIEALVKSRDSWRKKAERLLEELAAANYVIGKALDAVRGKEESK